MACQLCLKKKIKRRDCFKEKEVAMPKKYTLLLKNPSIVLFIYRTKQQQCKMLTSTECLLCARHGAKNFIIVYIFKPPNLRKQVSSLLQIKRHLKMGRMPSIRKLVNEEAQDLSSDNQALDPSLLTTTFSIPQSTKTLTISPLITTPFPLCNQILSILKNLQGPKWASFLCYALT